MSANSALDLRLPLPYLQHTRSLIPESVVLKGVLQILGILHPSLAVTVPLSRGGGLRVLDQLET